MRRTLQLAAIGTAAGAFSGLFGVGGGVVIVPLLIFWLGYGDREATGTSMAAIIVIATFAVVFLVALVMGAAALAARGGGRGGGGPFAATALQQRLPERAVGIIFAVLLLVIAAELVFS